MKELSIEEKALAYDKVIGALRSLIAEQAIKHCDRVNIKDITNIFSELKESDDEKKELKKIEQNLAWSEEDEYKYNTILHHLDLRKEKYKRECNQEEQDRYQCLYEWLKSLKVRVQPQPKREWSEEDKRKIDRIYSILRQAADTHAFSTSCRLIGDKECIELQDFLKFLRPQNTWKPSDEQMDALNDVIRNAHLSNANEAGLIGLYNDLKKL